MSIEVFGTTTISKEKLINLFIDGITFPEVQDKTKNITDAGHLGEKESMHNYKDQRPNKYSGEICYYVVLTNKEAVT